MLIDQKTSFEKLKTQIPNDSDAYSELEKLIAERSTLIELCSNCCRLTADTQHDASVRRGLVIGALLNASEPTKEVLKVSPIDQYLFGKKLS